MVTNLKQLRFRPSPLGTLLAVVFTGAFVVLGLWQVGRVQEKTEMFEVFTAMRALPAINIADQAVDIERDRYREAFVDGVFEPDRQILVDNVVHDGRQGFQVFAPLTLDDGRRLLVNRGWLARPGVRGEAPDVPLADGVVSVSGWLDYPRSLPVIIPGDITVEDRVWPYLDMEAVARSVGEPLPGYVIRAASDDSLGLVQKTPDFDPKTGMHIGYAIQWFAFAAFAAGTYIALSMRKTA